MDDDRFEKLESQLAHQEVLLAELNDVLTGQQAQLTKLRAMCETLVDRVRSVSDGAPEGRPEDERPPHY